LIIQNTMNKRPPTTRNEKRLSESESPSNDDEATSPLSNEPSLAGDITTDLCDMEVSLSGPLVGEPESTVAFNPSLNLLSILSVPTLDIQIRNALLSVLPKGAGLSRALDENNELWLDLQYLSPEIPQKYRNLREFAGYALSNGNMFDVASVAQTLAFADGTAKDAIRLIDRWIIADERYLSTVDGLRRAVIQSKLVMEQGNFNLSWQVSRSNLNQGLSLGLHRNRLSMEAIRMWWAMFYTDRQLSLLLGRPYGVSEKHCHIPTHGKPVGGKWTYAAVMMHAAHISGKIIDHVQAVELEDASHGIIQLEGELGQLVSRIPEDGSVQDAHVGPGRSLSRERHMALLLLCQCYLSLYIPYLSESSQNPEYAFVQERCIQNCRNYLYHFRLFHQPLQTMSHREYDDSALAAVVVLMVLNLPRLDKVGDVNEQMQDAIDLELISATMDILDGHQGLFSPETSTLYNSLRGFVKACSSSLDPIWLSLQLPSLSYLQFSGAKSIGDLISVAKSIFV
jgi:hypothetical protein